MRKTFLAFILFSIALVSTAILGCKEDAGVDYTATADCSAIVATDNTYEKAVKVILNNNCALSGCHNAATATEGVNLSDYTNVKKAFQNKPVLCAIHHGSGCEPMPNTGGQLSNSDINKIDCWAKSGYPE